MNRLQFIKELKNGLLNTIKAASEPIIDEKIELLEKISDEAVGVHWHPIGVSSIGAGEFKQLFLVNKPVTLFLQQGDYVTVVNICNDCGNVLHLSQVDRQFKCFNCEKSYSVIDGTGNLSITKWPVKKTDNGLKVGIIDLID